DDPGDQAARNAEAAGVEEEVVALLQDQVVVADGVRHLELEGGSLAPAGGVHRPRPLDRAAGEERNEGAGHGAAGDGRGTSAEAQGANPATGVGDGDRGQHPEEAGTVEVEPGTRQQDRPGGGDLQAVEDGGQVAAYGGHRGGAS